jgi:hypothetical protein
LFWHDKIFDVTGVGSIVRVLADRNKVWTAKKIELTKIFSANVRFLLFVIPSKIPSIHCRVQKIFFSWRSFYKT